MADAFLAGQHEAKIQALSNDMVEVKGSLLRIEKLLAERKGERQVAKYFAGAVGGVTAAILGGIFHKIWP